MAAQPSSRSAMPASTRGCGVPMKVLVLGGTGRRGGRPLRMGAVGVKKACL